MPGRVLRQPRSLQRPFPLLGGDVRVHDLTVQRVRVFPGDLVHVLRPRPARPPPSRPRGGPWRAPEARDRGAGRSRCARPRLSLHEGGGISAPTASRVTRFPMASLLLIAHVLRSPAARRQAMTNISSVRKRSDNTWGPADVTRIMSCICQEPTCGARARTMPAANAWWPVLTR